MTVHELKVWPGFFDAIWNGSKPFELRFNDRGFAVGDGLALREYGEDRGYTGRECYRTVVSVLVDWPGLEDGYCILGLAA